MRAFPVVLHSTWLLVPRHPPIWDMILWCPCRLFLSPVAYLLGLCLFLPLVLHILRLIVLFLVVCYLWCGFPWFSVFDFNFCSDVVVEFPVCLWFLPYALRTRLLLTMPCCMLWRLGMLCKPFSSVLLLCSLVLLGLVGGLLLSFLSFLMPARLWSWCLFLLPRWWFFHIVSEVAW